MELTKQEVIKKILSFNYRALKEWIRRRLQGDDDYFPLYLNGIPNFSEFLARAFYYIEDERFRDNFIEILGKLTGELRKLTKAEIENSRDYIIELLKLCGNIRQFENKDYLMELAVSGKFKGIEIDEETDLHSDLLTTLASYRISGNHRFWVEQLRDHSNRYYANPAFYALVNNLDILFENITFFIDKFGGEIELEWGIEALVDEYGMKDIIKRFKAVGSTLSTRQKAAINNAFVEIGCRKPYKISTKAVRERGYRPVKSAVSTVGERKIDYGAAQTLPEKAGEMFESMGFEVDFNYWTAGRSIDIFIKKKKTFGSRYECYICKCDEGNRKVNKKCIDDLLVVREEVREEFYKQKSACDGCDAIIISQKGFTKEAVRLAERQGIELKVIE